MITEFSKRVCVPAEVILGGDRSGGICDYRHVYWYLLHERGMGLSEIGRLNGVSHCTVYHGVNRVKDGLRLKDKRITEIYELTKDIKR